MSSNLEETLNNYYQLINETAKLKGIIIDTRGNAGGSIVDINYVLAPLLSRPVLFGYTRTKSGLGRLDYTPCSPLELNPLSKGNNPVTRNVDNVPIVALADLWSASMGEITPMVVMEMLNGTFIGDRTFGAHGPLAGDPNLFYAGALENRAFSMYTSTSITTRIDGKCYEGYGVEPVIEEQFNAEEYYMGNDTQLERAVQFIHTGK